MSHIQPVILPAGIVKGSCMTENGLFLLADADLTGNQQRIEQHAGLMLTGVQLTGL